MKQIIVKKSYFDDVRETIQSINSFFASGYKTKQFSLDTISDNPLRDIVFWLDKVDPLFIKDPDTIDQLATQLFEYSQGKSFEELNVDETFSHMSEPMLAIKFLKLIEDNFGEFSKIINGVYDLSLFITPSKYKSEMNLLLSITTLTDVVGERENESQSLMEIRPISIEPIAKFIVEDHRIQFPEELQNKDEQIKRVSDFEDLMDVEVVIDTTPIQEAVDESDTTALNKGIQDHIRYENGQFQISNEYKERVNFFITELNKCETSKDLFSLFNMVDEEGLPKLSPDDYYPLIPAILARVFNNTRKYPFDTHNVDSITSLMKIHDDKIGNNKGAERFSQFDLFSCFKIDKEATIKFLEDFLKLNLVNGQDTITISNNTLLTIFNIFDSNLYLSFLYDNISTEDRKDDMDSLSSFIKSVRSKINKNSRAANVYKTKDPSLKSPVDDEEAPTVEDTEDDIVEESFDVACLRCLGDMSTTDMQFCGIYEYLLESEITSYNNSSFNQGWGELASAEYLGESFAVMDHIEQKIILEQETGDLPDYLKRRMGLSDDGSGDGSMSSAPMNPITDLADSIDTRLSGNGQLEDQLGRGFVDTDDTSGKIVKNITNITIRDSHIGNRSSEKNDLSTGKTSNVSNSNNKKTSKHENTGDTSTVTNDLSSRIRNNNSDTNSNNINNSRTSEESTGFGEMDISSIFDDNMFSVLESDDTPSEDFTANKPKKDLLTTAMDFDKDTLASQQGTRSKVQKGVNTVRAVTKPFKRTQSWLVKIVNSLIKRDEDKVKAEIIENPSYRTSLFKASRIALKFGLLGICYTITPYLGAAYLLAEGSKMADRHRLKKEIQEEFTAEIQIIDDKISRASREDTPSSRLAVWKLMRLKSKMQRVVIHTHKDHLKRNSTIET